MLNRQVKLISKVYPLKYILAKVALTGRIAKWVIILSEFGIDYVDMRSIKGKIIVDQLAKALMEDHQPLIIDFPDESILLTKQTGCWTLYFYGSHTQHGLGVGILFLTP